MRILVARLLPVVAVVVLIASASPLTAGAISLTWDALPEAEGYTVHYGTAPGVYTFTQDVGANTSWTLQGLQDCTDYFVAVKAYSQSGYSLEYSNEVSGWARPEIGSLDPDQAQQGDQLTLNIMGANFATGAELALDTTSLPKDEHGDPLVRLDNVTVVSCTQIQALLTVEPGARGMRAAEVGDCPLELEVRNPDSVFGSDSVTLQISFDTYRSDINRSDSTTTDRVDGKDLVWLAHAHGTQEGDATYNPDADLDGDGQVDGVDLALLATGFGKCWNGSGWSDSACP